MVSEAITLPSIVDVDTWQKSSERLREQEKAATRALDALAAERRRHPVTEVSDAYRFHSASGHCSLLDLFEQRRQLILYHHMLKPQDDAPCSGCCMIMDHIGHLSHLHARDTTFAVVAQAPFAEIDALRTRMQWHMPWYETADSFSVDMGITTGFGVSVFLQHDERVYRSYFTSHRGVETLGSTWTLLDITPLGRQETWEESPDGWPQSAPYQWWRRHDEY